MRFLLNAQHYADKLLEAGQEVGDGEASVHPWRHLKDIKKQNIKAGMALAPSREMTAIDDEAKKMMHEAFGTDTPESDPTKAIPLQGTGSVAKSPPIVAKMPAVPPKAPSPSTQTYLDKK